MKFKDYMAESRDPPMLLQLRRQGIRNFPNGERVALFSNPQLGIQLAVPYDYSTGKLKPTNVLPIKEQNVISLPIEKLSHETYDDHPDRLKELQKSIEKHGIKEPLEIWNHKGHYSVQDGKHRLEIARKLKMTHVPAIVQEEFNDQRDIVNCLHNAYETLTNKKEHSDLDRALFNWLSSEIEEHGEFKDMDKDVLDDVYDDYKALTENTIQEGHPHVRRFKDFADWYEQAARKGRNETNFKSHNNGDATSAFHNGKRIGTFDHTKREGHVTESVIHHLNRIVKTGEESEVNFSNGEVSRIHPVTAQSVVDLYNKVNDGNQRKISEMINSGAAGLNKIADFAMTMLKRGNN